jgi:hypothetical protein
MRRGRRRGLERSLTGWSLSKGERFFTAKKANVEEVRLERAGRRPGSSTEGI